MSNSEKQQLPTVIYNHLYLDMDNDPTLNNNHR